MRGAESLKRVGVCVWSGLFFRPVGIIAVLLAEGGPVRDVIFKYDLLWVGRARQKFLSRTDLLEDLLRLCGHKKYHTILFDLGQPEGLQTGFGYNLDVLVARIQPPHNHRNHSQ